MLSTNDEAMSPPQKKMSPLPEKLRVSRGGSVFSGVWIFLACRFHVLGLEAP